jgi:hypothetical protein
MLDTLVLSVISIVDSGDRAQADNITVLRHQLVQFKSNLA